MALCGPRTRVAVVDMQLPTGAAAALAPAAALACRLGGSDPSAHPWTLLEHDAPDTEASSLRGGHIQIRAGTPRSARQPLKHPAPQRTMDAEPGSAMQITDRRAARP